MNRELGCGPVMVTVIPGLGTDSDGIHLLPQTGTQLRHVRHCPRLGGASLSTVVSAANANTQHIDMLHGQLAAEREAVQRLVAQNSRLQQQLEQARRELRAERQRRFIKDRPAVVEQPVVVPLRKRRK